MTPLQQSAWNEPFLTGLEGGLKRIEEPKRDWRVGLSINL